MTPPGTGAPGGAGATHGDAHEWERHAQWWQDHFTDGADPEYTEQILPLLTGHIAGATRVLEVGCGEGQVARAISARGGVTVTGCDPSAAQLATAVRRDGGVRYLRATATALPVGDASVDGVVVCLVFEHLDDLAGAVGEVARVLAPGGRFVLALNHPLLATPDSGWVDDHLVDPPEQYWRMGAYLERTEVVEEVQPGVHLRFVHRPLGDYLNALAGAGLVLEHVDEPAPPPGFLALAPGYAAASSIPRLLVLVCRRR